MSTRRGLVEWVWPSVQQSMRYSHCGAGLHCHGNKVKTAKKAVYRTAHTIWSQLQLMGCLHTEQRDLERRPQNMNVEQIWASHDKPISLVALQQPLIPTPTYSTPAETSLKAWFFCPLNSRLLTWLENPLMPHLLFWHHGMTPRILHGGAPAHQQLWCPPKAAGKGLSAQRTQINGKSAQ